MKYLESRPDRASGELTIKDTRIRIAQVINMLAHGSTLQELHEHGNSVKHRRKPDGWPWISITTLQGALEEATELLSAKIHA